MVVGLRDVYKQQNSYTKLSRELTVERLSYIYIRWLGLSLLPLNYIGFVLWDCIFLNFLFIDMDMCWCPLFGLLKQIK